MEEFAASYVPKGKRTQQRYRLTATEQSRRWIAGHHSPRDVAELFAVSETTVQRWVATGRLSAERHPTRGWIRFTYDDVDCLADERREWISYATAAELIGISAGTVRALVLKGELEHRTASQQQPSISRRSAQECKSKRQVEKDARAAKRAAKTAASSPPDDGEVWLSLTEGALVLRVSRTRVGQLVRSGRIPATKRERRWWIRRSHAESLSATRAVRLMRVR
ncbi:helix-turn-helix domain-containing protein [Nocardioides sp. JQ2195]|uniref:helix-turn-helix domain-containing protein n=1 Tax=Nocardioides sp. JQ2195 TaxID=2592334 RepID=UPI00143ED716|nr:helix-turn-helix domain-containing protein [Nocardioides sp. JQ2195]QIX27003.1 helix-turn-helix domain-containing protein [Nocardioides sp. JQ2195]